MNKLDNLKKGPGPGRPKGLKNKFPTALKDKVLHAAAHLESIGKDLATVAEDKPEWFYENFVKPMLPKDVKVSGDNPLQIVITKAVNVAKD